MRVFTFTHFHALTHTYMEAHEKSEESEYYFKLRPCTLSNIKHATTNGLAVYTYSLSGVSMQIDGMAQQHISLVTHSHTPHLISIHPLVG